MEQLSKARFRLLRFISPTHGDGIYDVIRVKTSRLILILTIIPLRGNERICRDTTSSEPLQTHVEKSLRLFQYLSHVSRNQKQHVEQFKLAAEKIFGNVFHPFTICPQQMTRLRLTKRCLLFFEDRRVDQYISSILRARI